MPKAFNPALHPRGFHGRFARAGRLMSRRQMIQFVQGLEHPETTLRDAERELARQDLSPQMRRYHSRMKAALEDAIVRRRADKSAGYMDLDCLPQDALNNLGDVLAAAVKTTAQTPRRTRSARGVYPSATN